MSRQSPLLIAAFAACFIILAGCQPQQPFYFHEDPELSHYKGVATEIEYPDVDSCTLGDVQGAIRPFSLQNNQPKAVWDLKLEDAIRIALTNNKIMRAIGARLIIGQTGEALQQPPDFLLNGSQLLPSIYKPALAESDPRSGVEAALSAFDTQFSLSSVWDKTDTPSLTVFPDILSGSLIPITELTLQDANSFQAQLQKTNATGGTFSLRNITSYGKQSIFNPVLSPQLTEIPANWTTNMQAEMRQPILRGAGVQFNRIAGPGAQPGLYNGVMLARINTDIALADFEASVRNLVADVETAYWELYYNYRSLDASISGRDSALVTWRRTYELSKHGAKGGEAATEAQARENYFLFREAVEQGLNHLYNSEANLRYLIGIAATDGRLIRPIDEPTTAKISFDWNDTMCEALARSVELRQQKWVVKRRELELIASKNFLLPQLDAVGKYTWTGFGNKLIESSGGTGDIFSGDSNAFQSLTDGKMQSWELGFQFSMPIGFRREMSGVRNAQLQLAKERAKLQEAELELSHQLAYAIRSMEAQQVLSATNFNRRIAAQRQVNAVAAAYETGTVTIDVLISSQQRLADAERVYYQSVVDYNKQIIQVHYRKGSLLEYNGVYLAEGPWPGKAYFDARRRARARDASTYMDYGFTQPKVVSRGPYEQQADGSTGTGDNEQNTQDTKPSDRSHPELVPTPDPQPANPGLQPTPAMPEEPKPQPEAGAANKARVKKSTTVQLAPETAVAASGWKKTKITPKPEIQQAGFQEVSAGTADNSAQNNDTNSSRIKWPDSTSPSAYESSTNPPTAESNQSASGWKRISR